jgi:hypothetical protein
LVIVAIAGIAITVIILYCYNRANKSKFKALENPSSSSKSTMQQNAQTNKYEPSAGGTSTSNPVYLSF